MAKKMFFAFLGLAAILLLVYFLVPFHTSVASAQQPPQPFIPPRLENISMVADANYIYIANATILYKINKATMTIEGTLEYNKRILPMPPKKPKEKTWEEEKPEREQH